MPATSLFVYAPAPAPNGRSYWRSVTRGQRLQPTTRRARNRPNVTIFMSSSNGVPKGTSEQNAGVENVVIIGSGPAGYTAGLYAARANLRPLLLEGVRSGVSGGQLMTTADVENFPGFPDGVTGPKLMAQMRKQAQRWGTVVISDDATAVDLDTQPFVVKTGDSGTILAHTVIIATGASARRLDIPGEVKLWGYGISACAICDGAAPIFSGVPVAVVGGGDSACEEAVYLCKYASHVHLLVRGTQLRASKTLVDRVLRHPSVTVHYNTTVVEACDVVPGQSPKAQQGSPLKGIKIRHYDGSHDFLNVRGLFYAIGHTPNTSFLKGSSRLRFDGRGYLLTRDGGPYTGQDGVYAAGDVADSEWRQAVTAAASGCQAALAAERYLSERGLAVEYHREDEPAPEVAPSSKEESESAEERAADARGVDDEQTYNVEETWHRGEFALRKLYHESKRPLIVKYISPSCGPCKQLKPMLHAVVRAYEGRVHYVEIDITKDVDIAEAAGVTGSPTVQIFHEKGLIKEFRGVKMKSEYRRVVEDLLENVPSPL